MVKHNKRFIGNTFQESFLDVLNAVLKTLKLIKWLANELFTINQKIYSELEIEFANIRV